MKPAFPVYRQDRAEQNAVRHMLQRALRGVTLCAIMLLAACTGRVELLSNVTEAEGNEVLAVLLEAGLDAEKHSGKDGVSVRIKSSDTARALAALKATGLPRDRFDGMGAIFRKEGLISSPLEERARYLYALSQELANTLTQIDGVLTTRVHVVLPERGNVGEITTPSTAAIFIKHRRDYPLDALQPQIRRLVTHSIPGLREDQVTIVLFPAHPITPLDDSDTQGGITRPQPAPLTLHDVTENLGLSMQAALAALLTLAALGVILTIRLLWNGIRSTGKGGSH